MGRRSSKPDLIRWFLPVALPLVALLATAAVMSIPPNTRGVDIAAGRELFRAHCGSCHFAKVGFPAHQGPNLFDIGRKGASRKPPLTAAQYILESILDPMAFVAPSSRPGMPNNVVAQLAPDEIRNIVGFLASCGARPDYQEIKRLEIPDRRDRDREPAVVTLQDMELAEHVLRDKGQCLQCHSLHSVPEARVLAPSIFGVGLTDMARLRQSLVQPDKEIKPGYASVNVVLADGQIVSGRPLARTADRLVLCARDDGSRLVMYDIPLHNVEHEDGEPLIEESRTSLMPAGFDGLLTAEEIEALLTLIRQLN